MNRIALAGLGSAALGVLAYLSAYKVEAQGPTPIPSVWLQQMGAATTAQAGQAHVTGTIKAGAFEGDGSGLTNITISAPVTLSAASSWILKGTNTSGGANAAGLYGESTSPISAGGVGVFGQSAGPTGYGVYGISTSATGYGVYGNNNSTSGTTYGVYGVSAGPTGYGVYGTSLAASGLSYGVAGINGSTGGYGVFGYANASSGNTRGVYGRSDSPVGVGVRGFHSATSGGGAGGLFETSSPNGNGVIGRSNAAAPSHGVLGEGPTGVYATSDVSPGYGVNGNSSFSTGRGLTGTSFHSSGANFGVYGTSHSSAGTGVRGDTTSTTGTTYGVYGNSSSAVGTGVYGAATTTGNQNYGVFGTTGSNMGFGVFGDAPNIVGNPVGTMGRTANTNGYGVYSSGDMHVFGDFSASGSKVGYVSDIIINVGDEPLESGDVVEIVGADTPIMGDIPVVQVRKSQSANSRAVLGPVECALVLTAAPRVASETQIARLKYANTQFSTHATDGPIKPGAYGRVVTLGSFMRIKVDASFGPIRAGDLLVSSSKPGYAMAQQPIAEIKGEPLYQSGCVIGKALGSLDEGTGSIPVLIQPR